MPSESSALAEQTVCLHELVGPELWSNIRNSAGKLFQTDGRPRNSPEIQKCWQTSAVAMHLPVKYRCPSYFAYFQHRYSCILLIFLPAR